MLLKHLGARKNRLRIVLEWIRAHALFLRHVFQP